MPSARTPKKLTPEQRKQLGQRRDFHRKHGVPFVKVPEEHYRASPDKGIVWKTRFVKKVDKKAYWMGEKTEEKIRENREKAEKVRAQIRNARGLRGVLWDLTGKRRRMLAEIDRMEIANERELNDQSRRITRKANLLTSKVRQEVEGIALENLGISNRPAFSEKIKKKITYGEEHSVFMFDIDKFKAFNDAYGHEMGNRPLQALADAIREIAEKHGGIPCRYGGEEFTLYFPKTGLDPAKIAGEISSAFVRNCGNDAQMHSAAGGHIPTFSAGFAEAKISREDRDHYATMRRKKWSELDKEEFKAFSEAHYSVLMNRADKDMMYKSKNAGRNRLTFERGGEVHTTEIRRAKESK